MSQIKIINGYKYKVEKMACPFVSNTFRVNGGWGPWIVPNPTRHKALDGEGTGKDKDKQQPVLDGVICNVTDIPLFRRRTVFNKQGYGLKCDSGEYAHYHHSDLLVKIGTRVKKGKGIIGRISPDSDGSPNWEGPHCEYRVIVKGTIEVHPFDLMHRSTKLFGQYRDRQFSENPDNYIWTKLGKAKKSSPEYYFIKNGGWRSQVIQEMINGGVWKGTWQQHIEYFNLLNPVAPRGGWKPGQRVRIK